MWPDTVASQNVIILCSFSFCNILAKICCVTNVYLNNLAKFTYSKTGHNDYNLYLRPVLPLGLVCDRASGISLSIIRMSLDSYKKFSNFVRRPACWDWRNSSFNMQRYFVAKSSNSLFRSFFRSIIKSLSFFASW